MGLWLSVHYASGITRDCVTWVWLVIYHAPHRTSEFGTRLFLWWVRSQGRDSHASSIAKNTFSPVGIPLIRGRQAIKTWGDISLRPKAISSAEATPYRAALTKTRLTEMRLKQLQRQTKHGEGVGQLLRRFVNEYLWRRASPLYREYNIQKKG